MKHYFDGILKRIYKPSKNFFTKSAYPYLSNSTDSLKFHYIFFVMNLVLILHRLCELIITFNNFNVKMRSNHRNLKDS
jgi:hypothetical protein